MPRQSNARPNFTLQAPRHGGRRNPVGDGNSTGLKSSATVRYPGPQPLSLARRRPEGLRHPAADIRFRHPAGRFVVDPGDPASRSRRHPVLPGAVSIRAARRNAIPNHSRLPRAGRFPVGAFVRGKKGARPGRRPGA